MLIECNNKSFKFLIQAIQHAKSRILMTLFIVEEDFRTLEIFENLNQAAKRGVKVLLLGKNETLIGDISVGKKLSSDKIIWLTPKRSSHSKVYIFDDTVISTDRNISKNYYSTFGDYFLSTDLVFESPEIANRVEKYFYDGKTFLHTCHNSQIIFGLGNISKYFYKLLSFEKKLKIVSCTLLPSRQLQKSLITGDHQIITSDVDREVKEPFNDISEKLAYLSALPNKTWYTKKHIHYKFILGKKFCAHTSFNLDMTSEIFSDEHIVLFKPNTRKEEFQQLYDIWENLKTNSRFLTKTISAPLMFFVDPALYGILNIWK